MAAVKRDYYEVLGVSRDADSEAIRRAFHGLARDWHPDVAESPDAEKRFREAWAMARADSFQPAG